MMILRQILWSKICPDWSPSPQPVVIAMSYTTAPYGSMVGRVSCVDGADGV